MTKNLHSEEKWLYCIYVCGRNAKSVSALRRPSQNWQPKGCLFCFHLFRPWGLFSILGDNPGSAMMSDQNWNNEQNENGVEPWLMCGEASSKSLGFFVKKNLEIA